jgi:type II secretory pathway component GspD/PulD (secretin)
VARARSGETVILGGLIDGKTRKAVDGVPVISRIPILGVLFRSEDHSVTSRELVILITPSIRPAGPLAPAPTTTPPARP